MKRFTSLATFALLLAAAPAAEAGPLLIGGKLGLSYNELRQPNDPAGEPTVLFGTSFTGFGFQGGFTAHKDLLDLGIGPLFVSSDLLVAHQRGSGYAESRTSPARRTVSINTTGIHLPLLVGVGFEGNGGTVFDISVGPQLMLGLLAGSATKQEGGASVGALLEVRPVTHVGLAANVGMIFDVAGVKMPIDARFVWDPMVGKSTRDRFDNYVDFDNTGKYGVAFTWQASVMLGVLIDLGGKPKLETPMGTPEPVEPTPVEPEPEDEDVDLM